MADRRAASLGCLEGVCGFRMFFRAWEVSGAIGRVLVVHGLGEHSGRYERTARILNDRRFNVYAMDLRGHGRSPGRRGHVRAFAHLLQDAERLRRRVCGEGASAGNTVLLGHSLGGLVVLRYLQVYGVANVCGAVLVAPFVALAAEIPAWKLAVGRFADRWAPGLTLDNGLRAEQLFREEAERESYRADPLVHRRISARLWAEMLREAALACEQPVATPVLVQIAGADRIADPAATRALAARLSGAVVREYPEAYHDLYHDPVARRCMAESADWVRGRCAVS